MKTRIVARELKPAKTPEDFRLHCAAGMRLVGRVPWGKRVRGVWTPTDVVTIE